MIKKKPKLNTKIFIKSYKVKQFGNQIISDRLNQFCDNFGDLNKTANYQYLIDKVYRKWAVKIYKRIISKRVRFPNLKIPRPILDDRHYSILLSKTSTFDYRLNISTLEPGDRVYIPIESKDKIQPIFNGAGQSSFIVSITKNG